MTYRIIFSLAALSLFVGALCVPVRAEGPIGERFATVLSRIDKQCKRDRRGPYLDRSDPEYWDKAADTSCDIVKLRPRDWSEAKFVKLDSQPYPIPEDWLSTPEGKLAHSIKLPSPYDRPKEVFRRGMTPKEYFEALCREEAGEFVFQTITGVEVIFELRPRAEARWEEFFHLYAMEDPYGYVHGETRRYIASLWTGPKRYRALERRGADGAFERLSIAHVSQRLATSERIDLPTASYGFVWRGTVRPHDREYGIAGGELIAIDLKTNEVLGFRRGFAISGVGARGVSWEFAPVCPKYEYRGGRPKDFDFGLWFVSRALQPIHYAEYLREISPK